MPRSVLFGFIAALALASCVSAPKTKRIDIGVRTPEAWGAGPSAAGEIDSTWWREFGDPVLDSLIAEAIGQNFTLQTALARLDAAAAQARMAGAALTPQLNAALVASRRKQNFIGFPIPGAPDRVLSTTTTTYTPSVNLSWELDLWGRIRSGRQAALAEVQATHADYAGAQLSLAGQVSKAWFAAIEAERQVALAQQTYENYRLSSERIRERYIRGLRRSLDLRLARANAASAEAILQQRRIARDAIVRQLEVLLGRYPNAALAVHDSLPALPLQIPAGLPADLIARRPDVVAAERRLAAADARIREARAALYPQFSLTGSAGTSTRELHDLVSGDFGVWSIVGNLLQPLFHGGRLRAGVLLAKSQAKLALAQYGQTVLGAYREVESALANSRYLAERERALAEATRQAQAARDLAEEQYARGLSDVITLLEAQRQAYSSESQLIAVRRERLQARVDLYLALGGGFQYR